LRDLINPCYWGEIKYKSMKNLNDEDLSKIIVGDNECAQAIGLGVVFGGFFGGVGSVVGGLVAATGPECLGWW
jgi:hypothetical protein